MALIRVIITGRVQGVGFRAWTERIAHSLGLKGWVRNRRDQSVEAVFEGGADAVLAMLVACEKGPPLASIERVKLAEWHDDCPPIGAMFETLPTS